MAYEYTIFLRYFPLEKSNPQLVIFQRLKDVPLSAHMNVNADAIFTSRCAMNVILTSDSDMTSVQCLAESVGLLS